jgi:hypothetical protein
MNKNEILKLSYKYRKNVVFEMNSEGYIYENGNTLIYTTFLKYPGISLLLNESAKVIFLSFDGKRTLEDAFENSYEYFEGISKENYFFEFIATFHMLEKSGVLYSKVELDRRISVINRKTQAFNQRYHELMNKSLLLI